MALLHICPLLSPLYYPQCPLVWSTLNWSTSSCVCRDERRLVHLQRQRSSRPPERARFAQHASPAHHHRGVMGEGGGAQAGHSQIKESFQRTEDERFELFPAQEEKRRENRHKRWKGEEFVFWSMSYLPARSGVCHQDGAAWAPPTPSQHVVIQQQPRCSSAVRTPNLHEEFPSRLLWMATKSRAGANWIPPGAFTHKLFLFPVIRTHEVWPLTRFPFFKGSFELQAWNFVFNFQNELKSACFLSQPNVKPETRR